MSKWMIAAMCVALSGPAMAEIVTFDWTGEAADWSPNPKSYTVGAFTAVADGRIVIADGEALVQTPNGPDYGNQPQVGNITINAGGGDLDFSVQSVDMSLSGAVQGIPSTLVGTLDGSTVFTMTIPAQGLTTMTQDDLAVALSAYTVDKLTWTSDVAGWGNVLDNLVIETEALPVAPGTVFVSDGSNVDGWNVQYHPTTNATTYKPVWASDGTSIAGAAFYSEHNAADLGGVMFNTNGFSMDVGDVATFTMDWEGKGIVTGVNNWWFNFGFKDSGDNPWTFGQIGPVSTFRTGAAISDPQGFIAWNKWSDSWTDTPYLYPHADIASDANYESVKYRVVWTVEKTGATTFGPSTMVVSNLTTGVKQIALSNSDQPAMTNDTYYFFLNMPAVFGASGGLSTVGTSVKVSNMSLVVAPPPAPTAEIFYDWDSNMSLRTFWAPYSIWDSRGTAALQVALGVDNEYWFNNTNAISGPSDPFLQHRPGLTDIEGTEWKDGGYGWRGQYITTNMAEGVTGGVRSLVAGEKYQVDFDINLYANGQEYNNLLDVFFSTDGTKSAKHMGSESSCLGFRLSQREADDNYVVEFDDVSIAAFVAAPVLEIQDTDLGLDVGSADLESENLHITYTAEKSTNTVNVWLCSISILNKDTATSYSVSDVLVTNAAATAAAEMWLGFFTAFDVSQDNVGAGTHLAGYEMDNLYGKIALVAPLYTGWEQFLLDYPMLSGVPTDDFDNDGLNDVGEYGLGGIPNDSGDVGYVPYLVPAPGDQAARYWTYQLKDPNSGITYTVEQTSDLVGTPWSTTMAATITNDVDATWWEVNNQTWMNPASSDPGFFKLTITVDE